MARFTWDAMYEQLTPIYGGLPLWQSTQDMLDAFWLSRGYADAPQGDALLAFYQSQGAVGVTLGDLENDYWDRIGPNVLVGLGATLVLDARNSKVGEQWALNMGSGGQVLRAKYGSVARAEIRQGVGLVTPDGSSGDTIEVPDSAAVSITGDFELVYRVEPDDWTPSASNRYPVGKRNTTGNQRSWLVEQVTDGRIIFRWSEDGITELVKISTASVPFADAVCGYVKITLDVDNGASGNTLTFYTAPDSGTEPLTWTMLGSPVVTAGVTSIFDSNAKITFGRWQDGGATFGGTTKRVILRNGIGGTAVLDIDFTKQADFTTSFVCDTGQTVTVTAANAVDTNDPLFLPWTGENYVQTPGASNNFPYVLDSAELRASTEIEVVARYRPGSLAGPHGIVSRSDVVANRSFEWRTSSDTFMVELSLDGTTVVAFNPVAPTGMTVGSWYWVKFTWRASDGLVCFYTQSDQSDEPTSWNLHSSGTIAIANIFSGTSFLSVGARAATSANALSSFKRTILRTNIGGSAVLDIDFTKNTSQTSFVCTTGQTVTINRATSGRKTVVVTRPVWLFGTDDYLKISDNALLDFNSTDPFTVVALTRDWGTAVTVRGLINKGVGPTSTQRNWSLYNYGTTTFLEIDDAAVRSYTSRPLVAGAFNCAVGVRDIALDQVRLSQGGSTATATDITTSTLENSVSVVIGATNEGGGSSFDGEVFAVAVFRRALTPAEIAQIVAAFGAA